MEATVLGIRFSGKGMNNHLSIWNYQCMHLKPGRYQQSMALLPVKQACMHVTGVSIQSDTYLCIQITSFCDEIVNVLFCFCN